MSTATLTRTTTKAPMTASRKQSLAAGILYLDHLRLDPDARAVHRRAQLGLPDRHRPGLLGVHRRRTRGHSLRSPASARRSPCSRWCASRTSRWRSASSPLARSRLQGSWLAWRASCRSWPFASPVRAPTMRSPATRWSSCTTRSSCSARASCRRSTACCSARLLYRSRLVPRILPTVGLIGAPILFVFTMLAVTGVVENRSAGAGLAAALIALWEFSLGHLAHVQGLQALAHHGRVRRRG